MDERTLFGAAGINRRTAYAYERLLTNLLVVEALPAWTSNRLKRLVLMPKRHLVEPALVGAVLGLDANLVLRSGDLIGRLLETFVVAQLRAELGLSAARPRLYHLRQQQGRTEVDLLAELAGGRLIAFEVKADAAPSADAARHLATVRDRYPEAFVAGIVLHTGPRTYLLGDSRPTPEMGPCPQAVLAECAAVRELECRPAAGDHRRPSGFGPRRSAEHMIDDVRSQFAAG